MTDAEQYAWCQLLHKTLETIRTNWNDIDRELLRAFSDATKHVPVYLAAPTTENRELVDFSIAKFDDEFSDLQHSFSMRQSLDVSIEQFEKNRTSDSPNA